MKILFFDIETSPNLINAFGVWETDSVWMERDWYILCFAYKWGHLDTTHVVAQPDFELYKKEPHNDREVVKKLWELFNEADVLVAHNGDQFDIKKSQTRFIVHGLPPVKPFASIDTKKLAKRKFGFDSNKLNELGRQLGCGVKVQTGGYELWKKCMAGDLKAWKHMKIYNKQDVVLLEQIYLKLSPWNESQPNRNVYYEDLPDYTCPRPLCGGAMKKDGWRYSRTTRFQQYRCRKCGTWARSGKVEKSLIR